jgi:alpha-tubulin suppressor-like RCC1 family protein
MNKAPTRSLPCRLCGVLDGLLAVMVSLFIMGIAHSQTMPQDNWRYDGTNFGSPTAGNGLACIGAGSGGIYIGEVVSGSSSPTKILRFSENGIFISRFSATFTHLLGITCDSAGNVYVFDRGDSKVKVYSSTGTFLREWGGVGTGDGKFTIPANFSHSYGINNLLAIAGENEVLVCDPGNTRVQAFSLNGDFLRKFGQLGSLPGQFQSGHPDVIAAGGDGIVWLSRGKRFKSTGEYHSSILDNFHPYAMSKDGLCVGFVNPYSGGNSLGMINLDGTVGSQISTLAPNTYFSPNELGGIAFSASGYLYYIDRFSAVKKCYRCVREYSSAPNFTNPTPLPQAEIISTSQRPGTNLVDVSYRVTDTDSPTATTALLAFIDGGDTLPKVVPMKTFVEGTSGNVGPNQPVNTIRNVVWNMPADWAVTYSNIKVEALAKDERNLMGVHWITVPASNGNPAIQVSNKQFVETDLYQLWLWLIATNQDVSISRNGNNATVIGTAGIYNNITLASHNSSGVQTTTQTGRIFAFNKMGARPITSAELARAQAGNYGFTSLNTNMVVKDSSVVTCAIQGYGNSGSNRTDFQTVSSNNPTAISSGETHNLVLRTDGSLWGYGGNAQGQLGIGNTTNQPSLVKIADDVTSFSCGFDFSLYVKTNGSLWAMGGNGVGQLGDGTTTNRLSPVQVATGVVSASAGGAFSLFVKTDGTLWAMGTNISGQLADGTNIQRDTPVQVATGVIAAYAGHQSTLFIKTNNTLWASGRNHFGQLGTGNTTDRNTAIQVATGVVSANICRGQYTVHSLVVKSDGSLWAAGSNSDGQFGNGTTTSSSTFTQVATGVAKASAGNGFSLFSKTNGTLWATGQNSQGELGDGTTTTRSTPVQTRANMTDFAAGNFHSTVIVPAAP